MRIPGIRKSGGSEATSKNADSSATTPRGSGPPSMQDAEKTRSSELHGQTSQESDDDNLAEKRIEGIEKDADEQEEDETDYPKAMKLFLISMALCLSVFCMALDNTIISTAIPRITDEFNAINDVGWYGSAYLLTTCAFQLFYGKLYTFYSLKWIYIAAVCIFEIGSAICGAAPNSPAFIIGRAIAGLGASGIFSGAILIIANTIPLRKRPIYTGLVGAMYGIASVAGPLLGGVFTDKVTWRWCFYINLPLGAFTLIFIILFYKPTLRAQKVETSWKGKLEQIDLFGTLIFLPAVVCLLLALQWGGSTYAWGSARIIVLLVLTVVLGAIFVAIQFWKKDNATVPPRIIKQRNMLSGVWFVFFLGAAFFIFIYYLPIWFQAIKGDSAVQSGIHNIPMILSLVVFSLVGGVLTTVTGYYTPFVWMSAILMSIGAGLLSTLQTDSGEGKWIGYQIVFGAGVGFGMQQGLIMAQTVLPRKDIPIGTAMLMFSQTLGGALFISVAQNVFTNELLSNIQKVVPDLNPEIVLSTGATSLQKVISARFLPAVQQAYNNTVIDTFYVAAAVAAMSALGAAFWEMRSVKGQKVQMGAA